MLPDLSTSWKVLGRLAVALVGVLLLAHLVRRAGPSRIVEGVASVGWGLVLVIALAGLALAVRTWAWRSTLLDGGPRPSFGRMFALRLVSEAAGQAGVFGQVFGDAWRVARLGAELPLASRITSVALDRALYTLSSIMVTIAGVTSVAFLLPLPGKWALYAKLFASILICSVSLAVIAVRRRWPVISGPVTALGRIGGVAPWVERKREAIQALETRLLDFFQHSPAAFRLSFALQLLAHAGAVLEVYLILRLMGRTAGLSSALAIEGLTKLVNVIGMINPGNTGTYEGGNMLFARLLAMSATAGLTLALIRRVRALFWAAVGAICAVTLPGSARRAERNIQDTSGPDQHGHAAIIMAQAIPIDSIFARVGALPVLLRAILGAERAGARRIVVVSNRMVSACVPEELRRTGRLPGNIEWRATVESDIAPVLRDIADCEQRIVLIAGDRTYHPSLHRRAAEWNGTKALALTTGGRPRGSTPSTLPRPSSCSHAVGQELKAPPNARVAHCGPWNCLRIRSSGPLAKCIVARRALAGGEEIGPMVGQTHGWCLCKNEPQGVHTDQPATHQIPHHAEHW